MSIPQGGSNRLNFFIQNTYNESLIIFYRIEKPSGVEIVNYPKNYYSLNPNEEIAGNLDISIDPYLENRSFTIRFWIDSFTEFANKTIQSNKFSINLNVLSNSSLTTVTTATTTTVKTTPGEVPSDVLTTTVSTEVPTINPPGEEPNENISYKEYVMILGVIILFLLLPLLFLRKTLPKPKTSTSSQEEARA